MSQVDLAETYLCSAQIGAEQCSEPTKLDSLQPKAQCVVC